MSGISRIFLNISTSHSFFLGLMLGIPYAYPSVPYYWFAFFVFVSSLLYFNERISYKTVLLVFVAMLISLVTSLLGVLLGTYEIDPIRIVFATAFFSFFFFGELVPDKAKFILGYVTALNIISLIVILTVIIVWPFKSGLLFFSVPELRLWGAPYFPDWPNFLAFMVSLSFLFNFLLYKNYNMAFINITAALLTTSRTPLIAIAIVFLLYIFSRSTVKNRIVVKVVIVGLFMAVSTFIFINVTDEFLNRLFITSDREVVYGYALKMIQESPFLGYGAILFDSSVGLQKYSSFHNSYLDIAVRNGMFGLLMFLILIWPRQSIKSEHASTYWAVIAFFLIGSLFQNFLKHPHLIMMYTVITASRGRFR